MRHNHVEHVRCTAKEDDNQRVAAWGSVDGGKGEAGKPGLCERLKLLKLRVMRGAFSTHNNLHS